MANWTSVLNIFLDFHVNRSIYLLLNFNLNNILRKICQKSRDEGKEKETENNNGEGGETPLKNSVKQNGNETRKTKEQYSRARKGTRNNTERY